MGYSSKIENDLRLFKIFKKMHIDFKQELELLITPENILKRPTSYTNLDEFSNTINRVISVSENDIIDKYENTDIWADRFIFERIIEQTKIYLQLRPNLLEKYPELLI